MGIESNDDSVHEMEKILALAEQTQEEIDSLTRRIISLRGVMVLLVVAGSIVAIIFGTLGDVPTLTRSMVFILPFILMVYVGFAEVYVVRRLVRRKYQQKRALSELVSLVREIFGGLAHRGQWSALKKAEFRIRLSRFDIE